MFNGFRAKSMGNSGPSQFYHGVTSFKNDLIEIDVYPQVTKMDQTSDDGDEPDVRSRPLPDMVCDIIANLKILSFFYSFRSILSNIDLMH